MLQVAATILGSQSPSFCVLAQLEARCADPVLNAVVGLCWRSGSKLARLICPCQGTLRQSSCAACLLQTSPELAPEVCTVRITVCHETRFQESIRLVGDSEVLGSWSADSAPQLHWSEGHVWATDLQLKPGAYTFKVRADLTAKSSTQTLALILVFTCASKLGTT